MIDQLYIKFFILETDYGYKCTLAKSLFFSRLVNFGTPSSLGRKFSNAEATEAINMILVSEEMLPTLPEYWMAVHTYNCLLLKRKKWSDSKIFKEYLKNINQHRKKKWLVPTEIYFDDEWLEVINKPKDLSSFVTEVVRQSDVIWDTDYFSDEMRNFLYDEAYKKICERMGTKR